MKRNGYKAAAKAAVRGAALALAFVLALGAVRTLSGCGKAQPGKNYTGKMSEQNPLYAFDEVRELNENLQAPVLFGMSESEVAKLGFDPMERGIEHHMMSYRCKDAKDVACTLGTRELYYGEPSESTQLYVTGLRITWENRTMEKDADGSTRHVYTTSRSIFGIKVGEKIEEARKKLEPFGYETVYEEEFKGGLPKTLENTYRKGVVTLTIGAESADSEISQINVYLPYDTSFINGFNEKSHLPAALGDMYSVVGNPDFSYIQNSKQSGARLYSAEDGSGAALRGFPDVSDMPMTAEVSFTSEKYDALGVKCGMSEAEAKALLLAAGCVEDEGGYFTFNDIAAVLLNIENDTVVKISACLKPSTNLRTAESAN